MKRSKKLPSHSDRFSSGESLGGKVAQYRDKQNIYAQGSPADAVFFIQEGGVCLTTRSKNRASAVTAILGAGDLFGTTCLAGFPLRLSSAVATIASSIRSVSKQEMLGLIRRNNGVSNSLLFYLLSRNKRNHDHVAELLTFPAEQRLASLLLRLARMNGEGPPILELPVLSHQVLAETIGTTRSRVNFFMNDFRRKGYISYDGGLEVHKSLRKVLQAG